MVFLINNMSDKYLGLIQPVTNFYVWFRTFINQEIQIPSFPPYFMVLNL